jgi:integrase
MARTVRDAALETRTARSRLKARGQPYYRGLEPGLHLGYRKPLAGAGKWLARCYADGAYSYHPIGIADDFSDADGDVIFSFKQAQAQARQLLLAAADEAGTATVRTVGDVMDGYIRFLEDDGRSTSAVQGVRYADRAFIRGPLGAIELAELSGDRLKQWCANLARKPARVRTKAGTPQRYRHDNGDPDAQRARRASAKRVWAMLSAALRHAFANDKIGSDRAWRGLRPFRNTDKAKAEYLTLVEAKRLLNAADPEFRPLLQGALSTGARYGQLVALVVSDFNPDVGTLRLRSQKGRGNAKIYHAHLSEEAQDFFVRVCAGRAASDLIFQHADGSPWRRANQMRPIKEAAARAKIGRAVNFHITRTYLKIADCCRSDNNVE